MFKRFEGFTEPFPKSTPDQPLQGFLPFYAITPEGMKSH